VVSEGKQDDAVELVIGQLGRRDFKMDANMVMTGRTCVLGASGSGKSYAVGVLCEELAKNNMPFTIIDTEGEYSGLKEKYEAIWVGEERGCDLSWRTVDVISLATQAPDVSPIILDVSDLGIPREQVSTFLTTLYNLLSERRTPYLVILEEADKFIPQYGERLKIFDEVARRGRKRGLGLMICSQRPSLVDKNILSQCGNQLIGKLIIQNDLKSVAQFFPGRGLPKELTGLKAGEFYAMGGISPVPAKVVIRKRMTRHGGITPVLKERVVKPFMGAVVQARTDGSAASSEEELENTSPGIRYSIKADQVPLMVRRERRFGIFGAKETATAVNLIFRPLIQVGIRLRRGLLRKKFETVYMMLDGVTGKEVALGRGLEVLKGFEKLLGLTTLQVEVLKELKPDADQSAIDVASGIGESKGTVSRVLNQLEGKRLVRAVEIRKKRLFRRMIDIPVEPTDYAPLEVGRVSTEGGRITPAKVREDDLRDAIKGLWEGADVESFETLVYPLYRVELTRKRRRRELWIDGRTGKELPL
jgi:Helicase HerA, central domain